MGKGKGLAEIVKGHPIILVRDPVEVLVKEMMAFVGEMVPMAYDATATATATAARSPRWLGLWDRGSVMHGFAGIPTAIAIQVQKRPSSSSPWRRVNPRLPICQQVPIGHIERKIKRGSR